jgi:predicted RNase H-like HicB family nuclease
VQFGGREVREYTVVYEHGPNNWSAYVPDLPGCVAAGKTREETERLIGEAIELHTESMKNDGEPIPEPRTQAGTVTVAT